MKKIIFFVAMLTTVVLASCSKDDIGGTATEAMAGQWYVQLNVVNGDGSVTIDPEGYGKCMIATYNTAANSSDEIWVSNTTSKFKNFAVKAACNISAKTFNTNGEVDNSRNANAKVTISNGKILAGAGRQYNGSPADSIVFDIVFSNEAAKTYRISGIRYSGLVENED